MNTSQKTREKASSRVAKTRDADLLRKAKEYRKKKVKELREKYLNDELKYSADMIAEKVIWHIEELHKCQRALKQLIKSKKDVNSVRFD